MKEKGMTTINLKKFNRNKVYQYIYQQKKLPSADCPGSANGTFYCQSEFE